MLFPHGLRFGVDLCITEDRQALVLMADLHRGGDCVCDGQATLKASNDDGRGDAVIQRPFDNALLDAIIFKDGFGRHDCLISKDNHSRCMLATNILQVKETT
ncbi:hypothetical protein D3C87_1767780 [compost metagenome]